MRHVYLFRFYLVDHPAIESIVTSLTLYGCVCVITCQ